MIMELKQYPIDIVMVTYEREEFTKNTFSHLRTRTRTPYRIIQVDNGSNRQYFGGDVVIKLNNNFGLEVATNCAMNFVESEFVVTIDNDILVPERQPDDWLLSLIRLMNFYPEYAAISLRPQVLVGVGQIFKGVPPNTLIENNVCGRVARIMRTEAILKAGGWSHQFQNRGRGNEEWDICNKFRSLGYKVGIANIYAYHMFGENWGYVKGQEPSHSIPVAPEDQEYDPITCEPKIKSNE